MVIAVLACIALAAYGVSLIVRGTFVLQQLGQPTGGPDGPFDLWRTSLHRRVTMGCVTGLAPLAFPALLSAGAAIAAAAGLFALTLVVTGE
jgi:hypothetical protein